MDDVYLRLAKHLENLVMGYPYSEALIELLKAMFSPEEAEVALAIPGTMIPLETAPVETIAANAGRPAAEIEPILEGLAERRMVFSSRLPDGRTGYGLLQVGHGMPQTFFWSGEADQRAEEMARRVRDYFTVPLTAEVYGGVETKSYKYAPAGLVVDVPLQGVMPNEQMASIVGRAEKIAVAHCPCRMSARILGRSDCTHSLEVCIKYDELAEFLIDRGLGRPLSHDEAIKILKDCEEEGLVHMVDNACGQIKHTCNCCGHYCWNVGIIRRKKVPRDVLMAIYFIRETEEDECIGCGACADICPVAAVEMVDDRAVVDQDWCIGCGVCAVKCPVEAITIVRRLDEPPPDSFEQLHRRIGRERGVFKD